MKSSKTISNNFEVFSANLGLNLLNITEIKLSKLHCSNLGLKLSDKTFNFGTFLMKKLNLKKLGNVNFSNKLISNFSDKCLFK